MIAKTKPLFSLGRVLATPEALQTLEENNQRLGLLIHRHVSGDFGDLCDDDKRLNLDAIDDGSRIMSSYVLKDGRTKIWIITEAQDEDGNRIATTAILPNQY